MYDPKLDLYKLKKVIPGGSVFPVDMGFIPKPKAPDGDPMDVFIFMEGLTYPGCLIECRVVGIIEVEQGRIGEKPMRNDRIIAVPVASTDHADILEVKNSNTDTLNDLLNFCRYYNEREGRKFSLINIKGSEEAMLSIKKNT